MSADATRDHRAHRLAWCIALALFIPITITLAVVAFWPYPSPKPYRERALALMQGEHSAPDLERGKQAVLDLESIRADMNAIQAEVIAAHSAAHGPPPTKSDGTPGQWIANPQFLAGPDYAKRATPTEIELARRSLQLYEERGIFDRIEAFADTPILWADLDPKKSIMNNVALLDARGALRGVSRDLSGRLRAAAERGDDATVRRTCRTALQIAAIRGNGGALLEILVALSNRAIVTDDVTALALHPDVRASTIRGILEECNAAAALMSIDTAFEIERNTVVEAWLTEARNFSALDRLEIFATQQPGPREWIAAMNRAHDALQEAARTRDPRESLDLSHVPTWQLPLNIANLDVHDYCVALDRARLSKMTLETKFDAARLLLAITLYQREKGRPPLTLADLVPDYLPAIPEDPYAPDKQFRYRLLPALEANQRKARFILYSVGYDAVDNNATPPSPDTKDPLAPLHSDKLPNTDAIFHPRLTRQ